MTVQPAGAGDAARAAELESRRQELLERLRRGDEFIRAATSPEQRATYERRWLDLLAEYERVCEEIAHLEGVAE